MLLPGDGVKLARTRKMIETFCASWWIFDFYTIAGFIGYGELGSCWKCPERMLFRFLIFPKLWTEEGNKQSLWIQQLLRMYEVWTHVLFHQSVSKVCESLCLWHSILGAELGSYVFLVLAVCLTVHVWLWILKLKQEFLKSRFAVQHLLLIPFHLRTDLWNIAVFRLVWNLEDILSLTNTGHTFWCFVVLASDQRMRWYFWRHCHAVLLCIHRVYGDLVGAGRVWCLSVGSDERSWRWWFWILRVDGQSCDMGMLPPLLSAASRHMKGYGVAICLGSYQSHSPLEL